MKRIKIKIYYFWLTFLIIIPFIISLIYSYLNYKFLDILGLFRTIEPTANQVFALPLLILDWRERKLKYFIRGYELTLEI
jgi:hypothetical protein